MDESTRMLPGLAIGIVLMIVLVSKTKVHTFIALLLAAITKKWTGWRQDCRRPVHFFVISIIAKYSIFSRLSSVGKTLLDFVTFRSCRLKPSIVFVV